MASESKQVQVQHDPDTAVPINADPDLEAKELREVEHTGRSDDVLAEFDKKEARRVLRKIDYRLVPLLGVLYL